MSQVQKSYYCVLLAGGVGRRFWPYSRRDFPKQFIDLLGTGESLLQMTYRRFADAGFKPEQILVVTNQVYESLVKEQLPYLPPENILLESNSRNTAAAIAYATMHLYARDREATLVASPSDHLVTRERDFSDKILQGLEYAASHDEIVALGLRPHYPETGYGYIQAVDPENPDHPLQEGALYPIKTFTEKPNKYMAKVLVDSGEFFWNSGVYISKACHLLEEFKQHQTELYERLMERPEVWGSKDEQAYVLDRYPYCPNISFDYGVMEHVEQAQMLLANPGWVDVGSWGALYAVSDKDANENVILGSPDAILDDSSRNMVMVDDPDTLVVLQGVEGLMVVKNKDVLLVCKRGEEHKLKQVVPYAQGINDKYIK